jgi:hypothetical protein
VARVTASVSSDNGRQTRLSTRRSLVVPIDPLSHASELGVVTLCRFGENGGRRRGRRAVPQKKVSSLIPKRRDVRVGEGARLEGEACDRHLATPKHANAPAIRGLTLPNDHLVGVRKPRCSFEVLSPIYHSSITIDSLTYRVLRDTL